jgi:hypothetical protein
VLAMRWGGLAQPPSGSRATLPVVSTRLTTSPGVFLFPFEPRKCESVSQTICPQVGTIQICKVPCIHTGDNVNNQH